MIAGITELVAVDLDPDTQREEWLASRLSGYGGSDVPAIVNEHPRRRPIDVWSERVTGIERFEDNERTIVGRLLEPPIAKMFCAGGLLWPREGEPFAMVKPPSVYRADRPWQRASADALLYYPEAVAALSVIVDGQLTPAVLFSPCRPHGILEIKTHGWFAGRSYDMDDDGDPIVTVPTDKRIQCAWYMGAYQIDVAYLACLIDTHLRRTFVFRRDKELEDSLLEEVDNFHRRYVLTGEMPPPDGSTSYRTYLRKRFSSHSDELIMSTPDVETAIRKLVDLKRQEKQIKTDKEFTEQVIKTHIGAALGVKTTLGKVTWKSQPSGKYRDKEMRVALYTALGWTNSEITAFELPYAQPDNRVLRTP